MDKTNLGNRIKDYEAIEKKKLFSQIPIVIRLDGKNFSRFTKGMERPFDLKFKEMMQKTTKFLVDYTNAKIGYTQSDEISLVLYSDNHKRQVFLDGKKDKINSLIASKCSVFFNSLLEDYFPERKSLLPIFDCRSFNVPTLEEGVNAILWRELDATKNSISMLARHHFSHKHLHGVHTGDMLDMLYSIGINWNELETSLKRGTYYQRVKRLTKFTTSEIEKLPPNHDALTNPNLMIERSLVEKLEMPIITKVTNQTNVFFYGALPKIELKDV